MNYFSRPKDEESEQLREAMEKFLESGGEVQFIPSGVYSEDYSINSRKRSKQMNKVGG